MCRFYEAARIFNTYIGLELQPGTSAQVTASHDYKALWLWVKAHRAEVASLAEAQLGGQIAELPCSLQSPCLKVPLNVLNLSLESPLTPPPPTLSTHDGSSPDPISQPQFQTQPTQFRDEHESKSSTLEVLKENTISQTSFQPAPIQLPAAHVSSSSLGASQSSSSGSLCEFLIATVHSTLCVTSPLAVIPCNPTFTLTGVQNETLEHLKGCQGRGDRLLIIQPCATGKSRYYLHFADQPKTLVILAQPFVSLTQQTAADLIKDKCQTKVLDHTFLSSQTVQKGILLLCSYEGLHSMANVAKQAIQEGLKLVICIDEVHVLLESVTITTGYRSFRSVWTFMSSLSQLNYLLFAMSATVRPKHQALLAQELGLNAFSKVLRTSPRRPEVKLVKVFCETKQAALKSLVDHKPQMILVMTKAAGAQLQADLSDHGIISQVFHAGMEPTEKGQILSILGTTCVIATTAFITGLNAMQLNSSVVWQFAYSFENLTQFLGRLARRRGTGGTCTFITYPQALQAYQKGRI